MGVRKSPHKKLITIFFKYVVSLYLYTHIKTTLANHTRAQ